MNYAVNLFRDLNDYAEVLKGNFSAINDLVKRFEVINTNRSLHFELLDQAILQSGESYKIIDVDVTGRDKSELVPIAIPIEILGFRLGKTFHEYKFCVNRNELLEEFYSSHYHNGLQYWIHNESTLTTDIVEAMFDHGYETFDKMMLNSVFGQIYYMRD